MVRSMQPVALWSLTGNQFLRYYKTNLVLLRKTRPRWDMSLFTSFKPLSVFLLLQIIADGHRKKRTTATRICLSNFFRVLHRSPKVELYALIWLPRFIYFLHVTFSAHRSYTFISGYALLASVGGCHQITETIRRGPRWTCSPVHDGNCISYWQFSFTWKLIICWHR